MKDTKILVIANCLLVIGLLWTLGVAQASAVNYQTKYKGTMYNVQSTTSYGAAAPSATFQSTSAYASPEWAEESTLNSDGTVNERHYISAPRRVIGNPGEEEGGEGGGENKEDEVGDNKWNGSDMPLGDALIPLMLCMCAYAIYKVSRRRKEA